ncbi:MAG TPA: hypothetical protein VGH59_08795 [Casimicrobiaceae bacterium]|jgi:uncharacterized protein YecE (DUF72 family)
MKSLLDPSFNYVPSIRTDLRKTFARIRREQRASEVRPPRSSEANVVAPLFMMAKRAVK